MDLHPVRSALFVPVLETRFFARAGERGAQALILDLEDAIALARKSEARSALYGAIASLRATGLPLLARVNAEAELQGADLDACVDAGVDGVMLPKVESPEQIHRARQRLITHATLRGQSPPRALVALVESPRGVLQAAAIAAADPAIVALGFGAEDYAAAIGRPPHPELLAPAAAHVAMCAAAEGLACWGLAASIAELDQLADLEDAARQAYRLGFSGTPAVHPMQVAVFNRAFGPADDELAYARRILQAHAEAEARGIGALRLDGRMIDRPMVERARHLLG